jgi:hypothetical protein
LCGRSINGTKFWQHNCQTSINLACRAFRLQMIGWDVISFLIRGDGMPKIFNPFMYLAAIVLLSLAPPAHAKPNPSLTSKVDGITVSTAADNGNIVRMSSIAMSIKIHGQMAETEMLVALTNDSDKEVEADFALAMPAEAVVTGYALDVKGRLIDGVLLDQPKAKAVYEDEIRKGIDPGLAEVAAGNVFKTRVYPILPKGTRTIRLRFMAPLDLAKGYILPLETDGSVGAFTLAVEVSGYSAAPQVILPFAGKLTLSKKSASWAGSAASANTGRLDGLLQITNGTAIGPMLISDHKAGRSFFQIADSATAKDAVPPAIKRMRIYWDSSLSRRDDRIAEEIALVKDIAEKTGAAAVDIVRFSTDTPEVASFASSADAAALLTSTIYRGGTSFAGLEDVKLPDADLCLLFSDGAPTIESDAKFRPDCRLIIITSAPDANMLRLGLLARASKGRVEKLDAGNRAMLADRMIKPVIAVVGARSASGDKLPFRSLTAPDGGWFLVGSAPSDGEVILSLTGLGNGITRRRYSADAKAISASDAAGALLVAEELEFLADNPLKRDEMQDLAKRYNVASPTMALLVLEEPSQYVNNDIPPPAGFDKEWMAEYGAQKQERDAEMAEARSERLSDVRERWAERKAWWAKRFDPPTAEELRKRKQREQPVPASAPIDAAPGITGSSEQIAPPQPPQVAPPIDAPRPAFVSADAAKESAADSDEEGIQNIIVTGSRVSGPTQDVPLAISSVDEKGAAVKLEVADVLSAQPYLKALDKAPADQRLAVLAEQEKTYGSLPAFYLDVAEWFRLKGDSKLGDALMLSALELPTADDETRLIIAFRLQRMGKLDEAVRILDLLEVRTPDRPQPKRSLALALMARGQAKGASGVADLERAFRLLTDVALTPNDGDFDGIEIVALMEANAIIPLIDAAGGTWSLDKKLRGTLDTDVRIVIEWTNDDADIDLWVIEPTGEKTYYGNQTSMAGGTITNDMTNGYGPEEYVMRRAIDGKYQVRIDGYSPDRLNPNGKGRVMVRLIRDFGRATESEELIDAELDFDKDADNDAPQNPDNDDDDDSDDGSKLIAKMQVGKARPKP